MRGSNTLTLTLTLALTRTLTLTLLLTLTLTLTRFRRAAATHRRFLQQLEPYILHRKLPRVTPPVLLALAHHHAARGSLRHLEALLLALRLDAMPQTLVLRLCRRLRLHSAAIAAYNAAGDYHSPVAQLMQVRI